MSLISHATKELKLLGNGQEFDDHILKIIKIFSEEGHSGGSAAYSASIIEKLLRYQPLKPLSGEDSEFYEVADGVFQNNRCPTIFKQKDRFNGQAYNIDGKIFSDDNGKSWFTNFDSLVPIEFPYIPTEPERILIKKED